MILNLVTGVGESLGPDTVSYVIGVETYRLTWGWWWGWEIDVTLQNWPFRVGREGDSGDTSG